MDLRERERYERRDDYARIKLYEIFKELKLF